jgi:cell division protein ZapA
MAEVNLKINGRSYGISCDDGQEQRVMDLGHYVDQRIKEISKSGAGSNEAHLLVLTALMMADEIFDLRDQSHDFQEQMHNVSHLQQHEEAVAQAIETLADRIDHIAERMQKV